MPVCSVLGRRSDSSAQTGLSSNTIQIVGIAIAAGLAVSVAIAIAVYLYRKRLSRRREADAWQQRVSVFPSFRIETVGQPGDDSGAQMAQLKGNGFSRSQLSKSVVMPEKAVIKKSASKEDVIEYYAAEGKLPRPFTHFSMDGAGGRPMSSTSLSSATPPSPNSSHSANESSRKSRQSVGRPTSTASWLSVGSMYSSQRQSRRQSAMSVMSTFDEDNKRKVRQLFHPTLPDELVLNLGERVTIVNTFDDGWCVVGRDSVFAPGDIELGAVPAWVFVKPIKGLKAERPIRTSSLGVTVTLNVPGAAREDVISWSNFA